MAEPTSFTAFIVAGFVASLSWFTGLTKLVYDNKGCITRLDERTLKLDCCIIEVKESLIRQDEKLDKLIQHILTRQEE